MALFSLILLAAASGLEAQTGPGLAKSGKDLAVSPEDVRMVPRDDGGYDLYLRKKPDIASVLLTETTKDPAGKADNFAYRATEYNEVNGGEKRLLNGKPLPRSSRLYSLISSTPGRDEEFGRAFHILIPPVLVYGYPWSRSGSMSVGKGTFINIRTFAKPYADYTGSFLDNPFQISVSTIAPPPPEEPQQEAPPPPPGDSTSSKIISLMEPGPGKSLDLVVCLDTTQSMTPYIVDIKKNLGPILRERVKGYARFRIGIVLFRDYWPDEFLTRKYPFSSDIAVFERILKAVVVAGGRDIPEAHREALYTAATEFDWSADMRQIILVTDAPPHPLPRGKILFADVVREIERRNIVADAIIEPATIPPPDPAHVELENVSKRMAELKAADPAFKPLDGGRPVSFPSAAAAIKAAKDAGATHVVVVNTLSSGALSETVYALIDASSGKTIARDVSWKTISSGIETLFVNGFRVK
jgi:hypothetical protein